MKVMEILEKIYCYLTESKYNSNKNIALYIILLILDRIIQTYSRNFILKKMGIFLYLVIFLLILILNHILYTKKITKKEILLIIFIIFLIFFAIYI